jgi:hypothetical protein
MQPPIHSRWSVRDILALAVVALCALVVLAAVLRPGAGFEPLLPLVVGLVAVIVKEYFGGGQNR